MGFDKIISYIRIAKKIAYNGIPTRKKQLKCKIYIVGGYVRDKIRGCSHSAIDLDFVVEGDGLAIAEIFHKKLGGKLTVYKKFLTASLKLKNGFVIDIATARKETYSKPAAMPTVIPAKLEEDLLRRDFTINALAVPILNSQFSILNVIDVCDGLKDIKNKLIRVLHKNSFRDDPTRILRAIRYACRFDFKFEKNTKIWMRDALKKNLLSFVSAPRLRDEFIKTLEEKNAKKILLEFNRKKILKYIDNKLDISTISEKKESVRTRLRKLLKNFTKEQKIAFLKKLCLPKKWADHFFSQ